MLLLPFADESADDAFDPAADAAADVDDTAAVAAANDNDSADLASIEYADPADLARATQASTSQSRSGPFPRGLELHQISIHPRRDFPSTFVLVDFGGFHKVSHVIRS